jgi:hypothetical protein
MTRYVLTAKASACEVPSATSVDDPIRSSQAFYIRDNVKKARSRYAIIPSFDKSYYVLIN